MNAIRAMSIAMLAPALLVSCKKEVATETNAAVASTISADESALAGNTIIGNYSVRGSRTSYNGSASDTTATYSLDYRWEKKLKRATDESLMCNYGDAGLWQQGWGYIISVDKTTRQIMLAPNDAMAAAIQPGSFQTTSTSYDPVYKTFNFLTKYTDLEGNDNEVFEILTKTE